MMKSIWNPYHLQWPVVKIESNNQRASSFDQGVQGFWVLALSWTICTVSLQLECIRPLKPSKDPAVCQPYCGHWKLLYRNFLWICWDLHYRHRPWFNKEKHCQRKKRIISSSVARLVYCQCPSSQPDQPISEQCVLLYHTIIEYVLK